MRQYAWSALKALDASKSETSAAIDASNLFACSLQVVTTGTSPTGTVKFQFSNDVPVGPPASFTPTNWSDIPSATVSTTTAGVYVIPKTDLCYGYIRVVYTFASGSGTITANVKVLGA